MRMSQSLVLALAVLAPNTALAASCQELATAFAKDAAAMSDTELGRLRTCVSDVLRQRLSGPGVAVPAPAAEPAPAPAARPAPAPVPTPQPVPAR